MIGSMHQSCYDAWYEYLMKLDQSDSFSCPICHSVYTNKTFPFAGWSDYDSGRSGIYDDQQCPKCGHPFKKVPKCDYCHGPVLKGVIVRHWLGQNEYVHKVCIAYRKELKKIIA